jgi:hypothetical protein
MTPNKPRKKSGKASKTYFAWLLIGGEGWLPDPPDYLYESQEDAEKVGHLNEYDETLCRLEITPIQPKGKKR